MRYRGDRPKILAGLGSDELVTAYTGARCLSGAHRLMLAVLADALGTLSLTHRHRPGRQRCACVGCRSRAPASHGPGRPPEAHSALRAETLAWFASDSDEAFTFVGICQALGLEPEAIREQQQASGWAGIPRLHRSALLHSRETLATTRGRPE